MQSDQVIDVAIAPSRLMAVAIVVAHCVAVGAVWFAALPTAVHLTLKAALVLSLWGCLRQSGWLNAPRFVTNVRIRPAAHEAEGDRLEAQCRDGTALRGEILEGNFVAPWLVTLGFRPDGARRFRPRKVIALLPDSASRDSLRLLRVRLRWGKPAPV